MLIKYLSKDRLLAALRLGEVDIAKNSNVNTVIDAVNRIV